MMGTKDKNGDRGVVGSEIAPENTGKISTRFHAELAGSTGLAAQHNDPDKFLNAIAEKLAARVGHGGNGGGGRKFLGIDSGGWAKLIIGWLIAAGVFIATWVATVQSAIEVRPTRPEMTESIRAMVERHSDGIHVEADARLDLVEARTEQIKESLIRQEGIDRRQTEILEEVRSDVKLIKKR